MDHDEVQVDQDGIPESVGVVEDDHGPSCLHHRLHDHDLGQEERTEVGYFVVERIGRGGLGQETLIIGLDANDAKDVVQSHEQGEHSHADNDRNVEVLEQDSEFAEEHAPVVEAFEVVAHESCIEDEWELDMLIITRKIRTRPRSSISVEWLMT